MAKVKLMCSYGGRIQPWPHHLHLTYFGGHTKILTVDRKINFTKLVSKLRDLCDCDSEIQIQVKYKLPGQDLEALISVFDDDDVDQMMLEYDLLQRVSIKPARFRLFVFFPATVKPVTSAAWSLNPDFLFGFDKEYSFDSVVSVNPDTATSLGYGAPSYNPAPVVYRIPANAGGYFESGLYDLSADCGRK